MNLHTLTPEDRGHRPLMRPCAATTTVVGHCSQMSYEDGPHPLCYWHRLNEGRVLPGGIRLAVLGLRT